MNIRLARLVGCYLTLAVFLVGGATYVAQAAVVTRTPYLQGTGTTEITVMWRTDVAAVQTIEYSQDLSYRYSRDDSVTTNHEVTLTGLVPGATYNYRIVEGTTVKVSGAYCSFKTDLGKSNDVFTFFVTADIGAANPGQSFQHLTQAQIRRVTPKAEFGLICGDVVYPDGLSSDYDAYLMGPWADLLANTNIWPALGNHDWHVDPDQNFAREWALPGNEHYYSFNYGSAHFIALDASNSTIYDEANQLAFLEADLQANSGAKWTFVYYHQPTLTCTYKGDNRSTGDKFMPLFEAFGVDIVFNGHAHTFERLYPIRNYTPVAVQQDPFYTDPGAPIYITTGAGGKLKIGVPTTLCGPTAAFRDETVLFTQVYIQGDALAVLQIDSTTGTFHDVMTLTKTLTTSSLATLPMARRLRPNFPNPFNPMTTIPFELARDSMVRVDVYRPDGRWITNLAQRMFTAGAHRVMWNGLDHDGRQLSSGMYFLNLQSESESETIKMMLVR